MNLWVWISVWQGAGENKKEKGYPPKVPGGFFDAGCVKKKGASYFIERGL
jgi:hypothetical protein